MRHLLPEWHPQWGVLLAWPHDGTDWADNLGDAEATYTALAKAILERENLLVICRDADHEGHIRQCLEDAGASARLHLLQRPYNDTWARDFGPIAIQDDGQTALLDFTFTGWGNKFDARLDNALNSTLPWRVPLKREALVLEGGALDTDGQGLLLTTSQCLLNPNRNPALDRDALTRALATRLGIREIAWLEHGDLEGDDTDAHVDTLARFCDANTVAYVQCSDPGDSHFHSLSAMEAELQGLAERHDWKLVALPHASPQHHRQEGYRLPATYANFLIINGAVLVPVYDCDTDEQALSQLRGAFPERDVIGIPCRSLIEQHGSLHCITMQLPEGVL